jgi:enamine deaminase RidA (YjgF/YER057c/UK114 family)
MNSIEKKLGELGIVLPPVVPPVANYVPFVRSGKLVFTAGQLPMKDGKLMHAGLSGQDVTIEQANACARQCAINILAIAQAATGDLSKVKRIVKLTGFVACNASFHDHPKILNGASDLFVEVFGEAGKHARSAIGVSALPLNAPVEVEAIIEVAD